MKFADLNPEWQQRWATFTPERGGEGKLPEMTLTFGCPKCGLPRGLSIIITTESQNEAARKWHVDVLPDSMDWPARATITPSIRCHAQMHGPRRPPCGAHFSIINGEVV